MIPRIGIDLGTTFSCVSCIDETGIPVIIKNSDGQETTASVIWFDGKVAYVGKKANDRKLQMNSPIYEFIKRDMGKDLSHRYLINGVNCKATGYSAMILKKLKIEAFFYFKRKGLLSPSDTIDTLSIPAVITVPAYFGFKERYETKKAGIAAGLDVIDVINEPTAAALTYGFSLSDSKKVMVFDLGGGTFDVTVLQMGSEKAHVVASDGSDELGGKNWDSIIENYLLAEFERQTGAEIPDDMLWEVQKQALESKYELSENMEKTLWVNASGKTAEINLYRERLEDEFSFYDEDDDNKFYFEERSADLLMLCKAITRNILDKAGMTWNDIDDIVLAGGSCRMPMIARMLENISGKNVRKNIPGYNLDTAIAQGAALYGRNRNRVVDVSSKSIGIEVRQNNRVVINHLIRKNTPLPFSIAETFPAEENAVLFVYEGESINPDECALRGKLELGNSPGRVEVGMSIDVSGIINATVEVNGTKAALKIKPESDAEDDLDVLELKGLIDSIDIRL
ncbi:Chaperone protein DnaK [Dyadobacter sp. CECT 9275]|uniref:Chaperone protein DnaK n=1 Tax=Dyadobacter helix TaxID=2822344 RepID=A0A916NLQ1_9BACT|nr:Hsp70 family protein [Dyadobacter sp. CECT 9275]CAG5002174.1 Chaperone protein DnaK [Dyadobacter sp. CECT 9275]